MRLKTKICLFFFSVVSFLSFSQESAINWNQHFSYYNIVDISKGSDKIYVAAENAIFEYNPISQEKKTISTVNGLSGDEISKMYYSETYGLLIIGYGNGLLQIYNEEDGNVLTISEIKDKQTIPPNKKTINHFYEFNEFVYISTDFGISIYNLERLEFDDTYFIGTNGTQIRVLQTSIYNDFIYAACQDNNGLKNAPITSDNLIDYDQWSILAPGNFRGIDNTENYFYALRNNNKIYEVVNNSITEQISVSLIPEDFRSDNSNVIVTLKNKVTVYDQELNIQYQINRDDYETIGNQTEFTISEILGETIFIGTNNKGLLVFNINDLATFEVQVPQGPILNNSFSISAIPNELWMCYGDYTLSFNPAPVKKEGLSHLVGDEWINISKDSVLNSRNLSKIAINPLNTNQVFISSFFKGILEVNDNSSTIFYDQSNSGLESLIIPNNPNFVNIRVGAVKFDNQGLLWSMTGRVESPLKSYNPSSGEWQSYSFSEILPNPLGSEWGYDELVIDDNGNKFTGGHLLGLIGYSSSGVLKNIQSEAQNVPSPSIYALALDNRNQLWVGTNKGLRVLYNPERMFTDEDVELSSIIINENGLAQELLFQQFINDIEVDGSNNKWIATLDVGVFYVSPDGQETIYHFTKDNSPLPSNNVVDVAIDEGNGRVYFATTKGMVSFELGSSKPLTDINSAFVYPNPVRPGFDFVEKKIKIKDISENVNIKITDIEGNLIAEAESKTNLRNRGYNLEIDGGTAFWNGKTLAGTKVASGVYLVMLTDLDSLETKVLKLMIVR